MPSFYLALLLLLPLFGAVMIALIPEKIQKLSPCVAAFFASGILLMVLAVGYQNAAAPSAIFTFWSLPWMPDAGISLTFAIDGTSWVFLLLTSLVTLFSIFAAIRLGFRDRAFHSLILVLQTMLIGVFTARHFIPWFLCWELSLIPAYLLVRLWGGPNASRAALRFFLMTFGSGIIMLFGFLALQVATGTMEFDQLQSLAARRQIAPLLASAFPATGQTGMFMLTGVAIAVFLGLAVKLPIVPFHAWLPDTYAEAPTPVTMLLTGILSKMGVYGLLRIFLPIFYEALPGMAPVLLVLALATILHGAFAALAQRDLKRILAYSSINHLGYCFLAIAAAASAVDHVALSAALSGVVLQAFNHAIIASTLFFGVGLLESENAGLRTIDDFGGLRARMPVFCGLFCIAVFASLGLPALSGFAGEFLIFNGVFGLVPWAAALSCLGLLITAVFLLRMIREIFHGPLPEKFATMSDISIGDRLLLVPAIFLIILLGILPHLLLHWINSDTLRLIDHLNLIP